MVKKVFNFHIFYGSLSFKGSLGGANYPHPILMEGGGVVVAEKRGLRKTDVGLLKTALMSTTSWAGQLDQITF